MGANGYQEYRRERKQRYERLRDEEIARLQEHRRKRRKSFEKAMERDRAFRKAWCSQNMRFARVYQSSWATPAKEEALDEQGLQAVWGGNEEGIKRAIKKSKNCKHKNKILVDEMPRISYCPECGTYFCY